jgi:hypothetical protein
MFICGRRMILKPRKKGDDGRFKITRLTHQCGTKRMS